MKKPTIKLNLKKSTVATLDDKQMNSQMGGTGRYGNYGPPVTLGCSTPAFCF